jgi:hypothetical protein
MWGNGGEREEGRLKLKKAYFKKGADRGLMVLLTYLIRYLSMSPERYEHLLSLVGPFIKKQSTRMREAISPSERLTVRLRYLASGDD